MSSMEAILTGSQSLQALLEQCVEGLNDTERAKVIEEFVNKFTEQALEYYQSAVKKEENWKRLKHLALEDTELSDVQQPEPVDQIRARLLTCLDHLSKYASSDSITNLQRLLQ